MDLRSVLLEIHTALDDASIAHALIGGLALAAHGAARATVNLDLQADGARTNDIDALLRERGYEALHRSDDVANYASRDAARGRVDFLFARRPHGRAMLERAAPHRVLENELRVVDAADLIGLKVQASSNDPARRHADLADIERVLAHGDVDLERVREYFRLFDREKELDALLAGATPR
ncbi:MAG: hypothetical protein QNK03_26375 [Myxococcota bacterium]|nr:hypothetical protein [Myxococcota bacterium]